MRPHAVSKSLVATAVAAALLGVAGCGSSGNSGTTRKQAVAPVRLVVASADTTVKAGSSRFSATVATSGASQNITMRMTGLIDYRRRTGTLTATIPGLGTMTDILTGTAIYVKVPQLGPKYFRISLKELLGGNSSLSQLGNSDPSQALQMLRGAGADVQALGPVTVGGVPTTHYKGTISTQAALAKVPPAVRATVGKAFAGIRSIPFDAYLDDQGRLRRMVERITLPASAATGGQALSVTTTIDLSDFGVPVRVTIPPASQTVDGSQLLNSLGGAR